VIVAGIDRLSLSLAVHRRRCAEPANDLVGDLAGGPPSGAFTLAAAPALFEPLRTLLTTHGAGEA
jgi:hypothetical protein